MSKKDAGTHLGPHKAEHAVDMVTGAVVEPTLEPRSTNGSNEKPRPSR